MTNLAKVYQEAGHTRRSVSRQGFGRRSAGHAAFPEGGRPPGLVRAKTGARRHPAAILAFANGTNDADTAERAAKVCNILPSTDKAELDAALDLARAAVKFGHGGDWSLLALGMAEYRHGNDVAAEKALLEAPKAGPNNDPVMAISSFFRDQPVPTREEIRSPQARDRGCSQDEAAALRRE